MRKPAFAARAFLAAALGVAAAMPGAPVRASLPSGERPQWSWAGPETSIPRFRSLPPENSPDAAFLNAVSAQSLAAYAGMPVLTFDSRQFMPLNTEFEKLDKKNRRLQGQALRRHIRDTNPDIFGQVERQIRSGVAAPEFYESLLMAVSFRTGRAMRLVGDGIQLCIYDVPQESLRKPTAFDVLDALFQVHDCNPRYPNEDMFQNRIPFRPEAVRAAMTELRGAGITNGEIEAYIATLMAANRGVESIQNAMVLYADYAGVADPDARIYLFRAMGAAVAGMSSILEKSDRQDVTSSMVRTASGQGYDAFFAALWLKALAISAGGAENVPGLEGFDARAPLLGRVDPAPYRRPAAPPAPKP